MAALACNTDFSFPANPPRALQERRRHFLFDGESESYPTDPHTMELAREVGRRVRALRQRQGLTQASLAERIDRSEVALRAIERGASAPSFATLKRLASTLQVPAAAFFPSGASGGLAEGRARRVAAFAVLAREAHEDHLDLVLALLEALASPPPK
jgi:transcriptional regulator with XRE-family HTH domain